MKILHTADWHIGQMFYNEDRSYEHQCFLDWLQALLKAESVDVLLLSGDVFDVANPAAASVKMFYRFLNQATRENPHLQIIITAGNHDSASRLETPRPLLESGNVEIVGVVPKDSSGAVDFQKMTFPLKDKTGKIEAWCLAVPFLRLGDYPALPESAHPYVEGVCALYQQGHAFAAALKEGHQAVVAMGHLHCRQAEVSDMDCSERQIMGGVECIPATAFHPDFCYVALGHIHKAQRIGGQERIRYSGSPIPMSFSERNYKHQVLLFDIQDGIRSAIKSVEVPVAVPLLRLPVQPALLPEVLQELAGLPEDDGQDARRTPYLEVNVLLDGPEPSLRHQIERALEGKYVRLARIATNYQKKEEEGNASVTMKTALEQLRPEDIFIQAFQKKYAAEVPDDLLQLFREAAQQSLVSD